MEANYYMKRYVRRGFEEDLIEALKDKSACILGLPGMGKTTVARYVYVKLREMGFKTVYLTSDESQTIRFKISDDEMIRCVSLKEVLNRQEGEVEALSYAVAKIVDDSRVSKILRLMAEKLSGEKVDKIENVENVRVKAELLKQQVNEIASIVSNWFGEVFKRHKVFGGVKQIVADFLRKGYEGDIFTLLFEIGCFAMGIPSVISIVKSAVYLLPQPKLENVVIIADDLSDYNEYELKIFVKFLSVLRENGAKVLFVKRIDDSDKDGVKNYLDLVEFFVDKSKPINLDKILFKGAKDWIDINLRNRIFFIDSAEKDEFSELLEANGYDFKNESRFGSNGLDLIWKASAGTISVALYMLEMKFSAEDLKRIGEAERYYSWAEIYGEKDNERRLKMIESNKAVRLAAVYEVYCKLIKNPSYLALMLNDLAEEEIEMFCSDERIRKFRCSIPHHTDDYFYMLESYEEKWIDGMRRVYRPKDNWKKLKFFFDGLCEFHKCREEIKEDLKPIREVLLDVMTSEFEKTDAFTNRMLYFVLENIEWLKNRVYTRELLKKALNWGRVALSKRPFTGFEFKEIVKDLWKECEHDDEILLYASFYALQLIWYGKFMCRNSKEYQELFKIAEEFMEENTNDDAVLCNRALTYSSAASGLMYYGMKERADECLRKAKEIIESMSDLKEIAEFYFYLNKAQIEIKAEKNPFESLKKAGECLKILEKKEITKTVKRWLKVYGGKAEEKFRKQLDEWHSEISYELSRAYMNANEMEKARKQFNEFLWYSKDVGNKLAVKSYLGRIEMIDNYKFEWEIKGEKITFRDLWEECKRNLPKLTLEYVASMCAEYLVSEMLKGKFKKEDFKFAKLHNDAFSLLNGIGCILGFVEKEKAIEELKKLDLRKFEMEVSSPEEAVMLDETRDHVRELYISALDKDRKREYEIRKRIEVVRGEPIWKITFHSHQALARIMFFYIVEDHEYAQKLAESESSAYAKLTNRLFKELAEAIEKEKEECREAKEKMKRAFVKLFYLHI